MAIKSAKWALDQQRAASRCAASRARRPQEQ
jgi:hypothetical protein